MNTSRIRGFIVPNLLVIPVILSWLLPVGIENRLFFNLDGIYFFLPNILYLFYIFNYRGPRNLFKGKRFLVLLLLLLFFYVIVGLLFSEGEPLYKFNVFFNSLSFLYIPIIYINWPLGKEGLDKIKYPLMVALIILCGEVILYSTGILSYTTAAGDDLTAGLYETGGIMRISTTVGAATGTAVIIVMLGCIITGYYELNQLVRYSFFILVSIALLFTISRGPILTWVFYLGFYYLQGMRRKSLGHILIYGIVITVSYFFLNSMGVFEPLKYRMKGSDISQDITTGREGLNNKAISLADYSGYTGVGIGNVYPEKIIQYRMKVPHFVGMHNVYLTYLAEIGAFGLFLLLLFYISLLLQLSVFRIPLAFAILCILLINFNTEAVFVDQEYLSLFFLLIVAALNLQLDKNSMFAPQQYQRFNKGVNY